MTTTLADQAQYFRSLHTSDAPLALPNVWDAGSTAVVETAGARAVATTSAGVAWSVGAGDGDHLTRRQAMEALRRVVAVARTPVTADLEGGYAAVPDDVAGTIHEVVDAGAVGINLEDGDRDPAELVRRLLVARRTADKLGVRLFVNARTDVFLRGIGREADRADEVVARAGQYVAAGADGLFVPGLTDLGVLAELTARVAVPVNVMAGPDSPDVASLGRAGVARVSLGSGVAQAAYAVAARAATEMLTHGTYGALANGLDYGELNGLLVVATSVR